MRREAGVVTQIIATAVSLVAGAALAGPPTVGRVDVGGAELYYEMAGQGTTVVLLHGGLLDGRMWDGQFDLLATGHRVIRYDARGHGRSDPIEGEHCHYCDLHALLTALGIDEVVLVGLSLGGRTAIDFTLEHPDMVRALVPVAPGISGWTFADPVLMVNNERLREAARNGDESGYVEWFQRSWTDGPERTPAEVDPAVRNKVRLMASNTVAKPGTMGPVVEAGALDRLGEIHVPTLVIVGEVDMSDIHGIADAIVDRVAGARLVVVPEVAHMVNMEAAETFNELLLAFLRDLEPRP
jgi:3-oxoadipate enol-lactonase